MAAPQRIPYRGPSTSTNTDLPIPENYKNQIYAWVRECLTKLGHEQLWTNRHLMSWDIRFSGGFTRRHGDALFMSHSRIGRIRISAELWQISPEDERKDTIFHEVCHIVDAYLASKNPDYPRLKSGRLGHGKTWKELMVKAGLEPKVFSTMKRPTKLIRHNKRYRLTCDCKHLTGPKAGELKIFNVSCNWLTLKQNKYGSPLGCGVCHRIFKSEEVPASPRP